MKNYIVKKIFRLFFSTLVFLMFVLCKISFAGLSDPGELSKVAKLGLGLSEAIADKRNVEEGLEKFAKDQFDDWMWDSIGGYEKLWTGQLDVTDAYTKQARDKIKKIYEITQSIAEFATKLGEGKYDEALFASIDATVNIIDHPVVKTMWAAAKMTYESHKLLQDTKAELEIETLYGIVNNDRRIVGVADPNSDQPKLIPENYQTADYFFEKYLITDDRVRGLVKTYVTNVLGEDWPEQTWSQWISSWKAIGSGVDTKRSDEIEALDTEFRNKARSWIMQLIKDLNKQVKVAWAEARVRQEMAEFQRFVKRLSAFSDNLPALLKEFQQKKEYRKELPKYKEYLANSPKALEETKKNLADPKRLRIVKGTIALWKSNLIRSYTAARLIGEEELSRSLQEQLSAWYKLEDEFEKTVSQQEEKIVENPAAITERSPDEDKAYLAYYQTNFAPLLKPFDAWKEDIESLKAEMLDALNYGDFDKAKEILEKWDRQAEDINDYYGKMNKALEDHINKKAREIQEKMSQREKEKMDMADLFYEYHALEYSRPMIRQIFDELVWMTNEFFNADKNKLQEIYSAFDELRKTRQNQWNQYVAFINEIKPSLPIYTITGKSVDIDSKEVLVYSVNWPDQPVYDLENNLKYIEENRHTFISPFDKEGDLYGLSYRIKMLSEALSQGLITLSVINELTYLANKWFVIWQDAANKWKGTPKLTQDDLEQIMVLLRPSDFAKRQTEIKLIEETVQAIPSLISKTKDKLRQLEQITETDTTNRQRDSVWLGQKAKELDAFFKEQKDKGILKVGQNDYEIALRRGLDNMAIMEIPFLHYATEKDLQGYAATLKTEWDKYPIISFLKKYAPGQYEKLIKLATAEDIKRAPEENFIPIFSPPPYKAIWKSDLIKAESLLKDLKYNIDDNKFSEIMKQLEQLIPFIVVKSDSLSGWQVTENIEGRREYFQHHLGKQYIEIYEKIKKLLGERLEFKMEERAKKDREYAQEEERRRQEEERKKQEDYAREFAKSQPGGLAALYGYAIINPRLNTYSLVGALVEVVLMKNDLKQGQIELTGRLSHLDKVDKMLFSPDNGMSWVELSRNQDITYSFTPFPDKRYRPILRIKTSDFQDVDIPFFNNIDYLVYRDIDYNQLVAETIKKIAEAYETQNLSLFSEYISRDYLGNKNFLIEGVRLDFDLFTDIRLTIYINRIEKRTNMFIAETKWDKVQTPKKTGQQQRTSGNTTFMFIWEEGKMKIKNLRGNLIYATLSPEIAQVSGLSQEVVEEIRTARDERNPTQPGAGTTEDSGGVSSGTTLVAQNSPTINFSGGWPGIGFDFTANAEVAADSANSDVDFEDILIFGYQFQEITQTFDELTDAPSSGYTNAPFFNGAGKVFAFITKEGYYGKMEVLTFTNDGAGNFSLTFKFALQTDGSRNLRTK